MRRAVTTGRSAVVPSLLAALLVGCGGEDGNYREITPGTGRVEAAPPSRPNESIDADDPAIQQVAAVDIDDPMVTPADDAHPEVAPDEPDPGANGGPGPIDPPPGDTEPTPARTGRRPVESLVPEPEFRREGRAIRVSFDDLDLNRSMGIERPTVETPRFMPTWQHELDGRRIRIRGFMYPSFDEYVTYFLLTRDTGVCCFGPMAKLYDHITVTLKPGTESKYIQSTPFDVEGTFRIAPHEINGELVVFYTLEDAVVLTR